MGSTSEQRYMEWHNTHVNPVLWSKCSPFLHIPLTYLIEGNEIDVICPVWRCNDRESFISWLLFFYPLGFFPWIPGRTLQKGKLRQFWDHKFRGRRKKPHKSVILEPHPSVSATIPHCMEREAEGTKMAGVYRGIKFFEIILVFWWQNRVQEAGTGAEQIPFTQKHPYRKPKLPFSCEQIHCTHLVYKPLTAEQKQRWLMANHEVEHSHYTVFYWNFSDHVYQVCVTARIGWVVSPVLQVV